MIPKSGYRFSDTIMLQRKAESGTLGERTGETRNDPAQTRLDGDDLAGHCRGRRCHGALDRGAAARRGGAAWTASAARRRHLHCRSLPGAGSQVPPRRTSGHVPAGAAHRRLRRASGLSRHAVIVGDDRDRRLDRARREPGAGGLAQACSRHQPRRQCRGDGIGGARFAHAASHARRHRRLAPLRLSGQHIFG